jgi:hypothetical protein
MADPATQAVVWGNIIATVIATGAGIAANALTRKPKTQTTRDRTPTTISDPGGWIPLLIGRREVGPVFAYAGNRKYADESVNESGVHFLIIGPGDVLNAIYGPDGTNILKDSDGNAVKLYRNEDDADAAGVDVFVSGSTFVTEKYGAFRLYWGDDNEPIDYDMAAASRMGVASRWPRLMRISWDRLKLGPSPIWPELLYDVTCYGTAQVLTGSSRWMPESSPGAGDDGINPAHALWQLATAPWPHGSGALTPQMIDGGAVEAMGVAFQNEHLPCNILGMDGIGADELISQLMNDFGFVMPQIGIKLVPYSIREVSGTIPQLTASMVVGSKNERNRVQGINATDSIAYTYKDRRRRFNEQTIPLPDDSHARPRSRVSLQKAAINSVTDRMTAFKVSARKTLEEYSQSSSRVMTLMREARNLRPGQVFIDLSGDRLRCTSNEPAVETAATKITAILDQYTYGPPNYSPVYGEDPTPEEPEVEPDISVRALEKPGFGDSSRFIWVFRVRAHTAITGAKVYVKLTDGGDFDLRGNQNKPSTGGTLNIPITESSSIIGEDGPTITPFANADDLLTIPVDLTDQDDKWQDNYQLLVCGTEVMSLKRIEAVSGGWRLIGLRRGVLGTNPEAHAAGDPVYIILRQNVEDIEISGNWHVTEETRVKTRPRTSEDEISLSEVDAVVVHT